MRITINTRVGFAAAGIFAFSGLLVAAAGDVAPWPVLSGAVLLTQAGAYHQAVGQREASLRQRLAPEPALACLHYRVPADYDSERLAGELRGSVDGDWLFESAQLSDGSELLIWSTPSRTLAATLIESDQVGGAAAFEVALLCKSA